MEIPDNLMKIYRHWEMYTHQDPYPEARDPLMDTHLFSDISRFVAERMRIWHKKQSGAPAPYTDDPILRTYRFCNIFRELDRQTIEFHTLLNPLRDDFALWLLNMFYCRMVARTETVAFAGLLSFDSDAKKAFYDRLMQSPRPRFGTPYVFPVSTIHRSATPTRELFIAEYLPQAMKAVAEEISGWDTMNVYDGLARVIPLFKFNLNFLWTEVLIDVAYQYPERIDLFGRFPIGPGSLPTMERISVAEDPTLLVARLAHTPLNTGLTYNGAPVRLSAENWEGIGCEFRKYSNLTAGTGRRRVYTPR